RQFHMPGASRQGISTAFATRPERRNIFTTSYWLRVFPGRSVVTVVNFLWNAAICGASARHPYACCAGSGSESRVCGGEEEGE
ncbi:hypothetical protein, partial [Falsigemmobacter intermedius]